MHVACGIYCCSINLCAEQSKQHPIFLQIFHPCLINMVIVGNDHDAYRQDHTIVRFIETIECDVI